MNNQVLGLGPLQAALDARLARWQQEGTGRRMWAKDHTVWSPVPVPELTDRLGWLSLPDTMTQQVADLTSFAADVRAEGVRHVVLLGMGGSSLAPEVFQSTFGNRAGFPELIVLDSTHPDAVRAVERRIDMMSTLFLVSSKSGGTSETNAFFQYFWGRTDGKEPGRRFVAITDPMTSLAELAAERRFRRVFTAPADVGGRYSALTVFGLVPAALIGVDLQPLLERARLMSSASSGPVESRANPALTLGAALGELALQGRDKLTFLVSPPFGSLPAWLEQLIAESTGKRGKGIVPIAGETMRPAGEYLPDRVFVSIGPAEDGDGSSGPTLAALMALGHPVVRLIAREPADLGQEFFRWEFATAAAGALLGIQPFDQPDVQLAKDLARRAMVDAKGPGGKAAGVALVTDPAAWADAIRRWLATGKPGDYIAIQAYLAPTALTTDLLSRIRDILGHRTRLATTLGFGPRFLHSTGQLHKGGPNTGLFLQFTDEPSSDLPVPGSAYTFGALITAQAAGDALALEQRGRRVLRIGLGKAPIEALTTIAGQLQR